MLQSDECIGQSTPRAAAEALLPWAAHCFAPVLGFKGSVWLSACPREVGISVLATDWEKFFQGCTGDVSKINE